MEAKARERLELLKPKYAMKKNKEKDPIYRTTTYNPVYNGLLKQVMKTWDHHNPKIWKTSWSNQKSKLAIQTVRYQEQEGSRMQALKLSLLP